ncbi:MAG: patatin-like phospholipase family protein [bacterium]
MGITIVQKSDLASRRPHAVKALILAGGAVTGGSFKAGGIKALNDYLDGFSVNDFDIFVGMSSGSMLVTPLAAGISPESMLKSLDGTSKHFSQLTAWHCYRPNLGEMVVRPLKFLAQAISWLPHGMVRLAERHHEWHERILGAIWNFVSNPTVRNYERLVSPVREALAGGDFPSLMALLPSGVFDNRPIEAYIRENIRRNHLTNDFQETFRLTGKRLYISAVRLDNARRVVFGPDEDTSLSISQAIQASTALPGFYKPARINGVDYVDGGVHDTADIDVAVAKGAELIVCYNPFRPYDPEDFVEGFKRRKGEGRRLAADGVMTVLNQILRAFFHTRLRVAIDRFRESRTFAGDIILIEPRADDAAFFALNPLSLRNRVAAAKMGFESVRNSIDERFDELSAIMASYGVKMSRGGVEQQWKELSRPDASEEEIRRLLEGRGARRAAAKPSRSERKVHKVIRKNRKTR